MVWRRCIHLFSSLSLRSLAALVSGGAGIKVAILIFMLLMSEGDSGGHRLKCLATVVSLSCDMSKM